LSKNHPLHLPPSPFSSRRRAGVEVVRAGVRRVDPLTELVKVEKTSTVMKGDTRGKRGTSFPIVSSSTERMK